MIKKWQILIYLGVLCPLSASFHDAAFEEIISSIENINAPTLEEYRLLENYLVSGERPYLDLLQSSEQIEIYRGRMKSISNFRLVGPSNQLPIFEHLTCNDAAEDRCILLYSSSNGIYPEKARKLLREIENSGYSGHLLLRIGGFPNTPNGGLKICDVPYSFKAAFLQEAKLLGFREILWIDLAIHPLGGFETLFSEIEKNGYFFTAVGTLADNASSHLPGALRALDITSTLSDRIPHLSSSMIGLDMENGKAVQLLESWYKEIEKGFPCMTWWPEELSLSVAAWHLSCMPSLLFGDFVCGESEQFQLENRPTVEFYLDGQRGEG